MSHPSPHNHQPAPFNHHLSTQKTDRPQMTVRTRSTKHTQSHADLGRGEAGAIEIAHGIPHIVEQIQELGSAEFAYRFGHRQEARIAHFENFAYCHACEYLSGLFHASLWRGYAGSFIYQNFRLSDE